MQKFINGLKKEFGVQPLAVAFSALGGLCTAALAYIYFFQLPLFSKRYLLLAGLIAGLVTFFIFLIYRLWFASIVAKLSKLKVIALLLVAFVAAAFLTATFTFTISPLFFLYPEQDVALEFSIKDSADSSQGVALEHFNTDFRDISFSELTIDGNCDIQADQVYCTPGQDVRIGWHGIAGNTLRLSFIPTGFEQTVDIHWGEVIDHVQLNSSSNQQVTIQHSFPKPVNGALIIRLLMLPVIFLIILVFLLGLFSPLGYAFALAFIWLLVLLVFWPGIIGDVNLTLIQDFSRGELSDWHPVFYTLIIKWFVQLFSTVSSFLIFQIISLALTVCWGFSLLERKGGNKTVLWLLTFITAVLPANFLSLISLTDDIPFSIALLALTIFVIEIVFSNGDWLNKRLNRAIFILLALAAILFRYNGIPAVIFSFFCLLIFLPRQRKNMAKISGLVFILFLLINGPIYHLIGVNRETEGHFDNILLHHISAHIYSGTPLNDEEKIYLNSIYPLNQWGYSCCSNGIMWIKPELNKELLQENSSLNRKIALDLFLKDPGVEINHILCAGDMVWNIPGKCQVRGPAIYKISADYYWTRSDFPDYSENSKLPVLVKPLSDILIAIENNNFLNILIWRPAVYLYLAIIAVLVFTIQHKNKLALLILAPLVGQSLFLFFFNRIQNFRYQYCAVLIGIFLLGLIFLPKPSPNDH